MCVCVYMYTFIYVCETESLGCIAAVNTTLEINYTSIQIVLSARKAVLHTQCWGSDSNTPARRRF